MAIGDWLDPNWRHQLSNEIIGWAAIGLLAAGGTGFWWALRDSSNYVAYVAATGLAIAGAGTLAMAIRRRRRVSTESTPPIKPKPEVLIALDGGVQIFPHKIFANLDEPAEVVAFGIRAINRCRGDRVVMRFELSDERTPVRLRPASAEELQRSHLRLATTCLLEPVAVAPQDEVVGILTFIHSPIFRNGRPTPLATLTATDSISGASWSLDLPGKDAPLAPVYSAPRPGE